MIYHNEFLIYFIIINSLSIIMMFIDKRLAERRKRRISEAALFFVALLGGSVGIYFGMSAFKHKTQKNKFVFLIPLIFAVQCFVYWNYFLYVGLSMMCYRIRKLRR